MQNTQHQQEAITRELENFIKRKKPWANVSILFDVAQDYIRTARLIITVKDSMVCVFDESFNPKPGVRDIPESVPSVKTYVNFFKNRLIGRLDLT